MRGSLRRRAPSLLFLAVALACASIGADADGLPGSAGRGYAKHPSAERYQMLWDQGFDLPPGSHLRFVKVGETGSDVGHMLRYRIFADAAQVGVPYVLGVWRIGTDLEDMQILTESAYVNRKGLVLNNPPNPSQQDATELTDGSETIVDIKAAKGEPVRFVLRTPDSKTMIGGTLVPFPIESTVKSCRLRALLADPAANALLLYADGFPANSVLTVQSDSQGATHEQTIYTDAKGHGSAIDSPRVKGMDAGTATETIRATGCTVSVSIPWGEGSFHPM
ncbi:MAG TPA: hypothetical protein VLZ50_08110 [Terracidiphilus sp.]|nr:hypothetical protein [Terracidiphilus sp.]